jgi:thiol-disulfide isomerase/thioredoxin
VAAVTKRHRFRDPRGLVLLLVALLAAVAWWLLPGPFAHGVITGLLSALVVLVGALLAFSRLMRKRLGARLEPPPLPAGVWDYDMTVTDLAGREVSFDELGGRVLVLNFWATWCAPCVAEMPSLERLREATEDLDVVFACITSEATDAVERFLAKRELGLPVYLLRGDVPDAFRTRGVPATFVLDRSGMVAMRHVGAAAWDDERVIAFVRGLAAAPRS